MPLLAAGSAPCWKTYATGLVLGIMAWVAFLGGRAAKRRWHDGRHASAVAAGVLVGVWLLAGLGLIGAGMSAGT